MKRFSKESRFVLIKKKKKEEEKVESAQHANRAIGFVNANMQMRFVYGAHVVGPRCRFNVERKIGSEGRDRETE